MSFELQLVRKRQSCQARKTFPSPATSAEGSEKVRMFAATPCSSTLSTSTQSPQLVPPFVALNELSAPPLFEYGTMTFPFGWTTGWPPSPDEQLAEITGPQVTPPSVDVTMLMSLPRLLSSNSM